MLAIKSDTRYRLKQKESNTQLFERNLLKQSKKASHVLLTPLPFQFYIPPQFFYSLLHNFIIFAPHSRIPSSTILIFSLNFFFIPSTTILIFSLNFIIVPPPPPHFYCFPSSSSSSSFLLFSLLLLLLIFVFPPPPPPPPHFYSFPSSSSWKYIGSGNISC